MDNFTHRNGPELFILRWLLFLREEKWKRRRKKNYISFWLVTCFVTQSTVTGNETKRLHVTVTGYNAQHRGSSRNSESTTARLMVPFFGRSPKAVNESPCPENHFGEFPKVYWWDFSPFQPLIYLFLWKKINKCSKILNLNSVVQAAPPKVKTLLAAFSSGSFVTSAVLSFPLSTSFWCLFFFSFTSFLFSALVCFVPSSSNFCFFSGVLWLYWAPTAVKSGLFAGLAFASADWLLVTDGANWADVGGGPFLVPLAVPRLCLLPALAFPFFTVSFALDSSFVVFLGTELVREPRSTEAMASIFAMSESANTVMTALH